MSAPSESSVITKTTKHISLGPKSLIHSLSPVFELNDAESDIEFVFSDGLLRSDSDDSGRQGAEVEGKETKEKEAFEKAASKFPSSKESLLKKNDGKERLEKSKQSTTKQSIKHETLFEQGQKINWVEMNKSKTTFEKRFLTKNSLLDKTTMGITNSTKTDQQKVSKIPIAHPPSPFLSSVHPVTTKAMELNAAKTTSKENLLDVEKPMETDNDSVEIKATSPRSLGFYTLENPIKISDGFESPPIEVRSMKIFKERMGLESSQLASVASATGTGGAATSYDTTGRLGILSSAGAGSAQTGCYPFVRSHPSLPARSSSKSSSGKSGGSRSGGGRSSGGKNSGVRGRYARTRMTDPREENFSDKSDGFTNSVHEAKNPPITATPAPKGSSVVLDSGVLAEMFARKGSLKYADEDSKKGAVVF